MKAEEFLKAMEKMDNAERLKLLDALFHKHFDNRPPKEVLDKERYKVLWGDEDEEG